MDAGWRRSKLAARGRTCHAEASGAGGGGRARRWWAGGPRGGAAAAARGGTSTRGRRASGGGRARGGAGGGRGAALGEAFGHFDGNGSTILGFDEDFFFLNDIRMNYNF
ncbi:unnamed protein product [Lampetra planeri]